MKQTSGKMINLNYNKIVFVY